MKKSIITLGILLSTTSFIFAQEKQSTNKATDSTKSKTKEIEEVVVIAYGTQKKEKLPVLSEK